MEYLRPYQLPFQHKNWLQNLFFLAICILIPIVGFIVILGYRAQLMDRWLDDGDDLRQKRFDFNRFGEYLQRGIWPFIYQLIIGLSLGMIAVLFYIGFIVVVVTTKNEVVIIVAYALYMLCVICLQIIIKFIAWPFILHGQITAKFEFGEAFRFAKDFYSRIGIVNLAGIAFCAAVLDMIVTLCGMLLCCVGAYGAIAVVVLADNHFLWQLYRKYHANGGMLIERYQPELPYEKSDEKPNEGI